MKKEDTMTVLPIQDRLYEFLSQSEETRGYVVDERLRDLLIDAYITFSELRRSHLVHQGRLREKLELAQREIDRLKDYERN